MKCDGMSGYVSDHVESDRLVDDRPVGRYVRVTHFPYEDHYFDDAAGSSEGAAAGNPLERIPLGEAYEVTVWNEGEIEDAYGHVRGATAACEQAIAIADELNCPVWNSIRRHRPEEVRWRDEGFETVIGQYGFCVRPAPEVDFRDAYIAVDRETGIASWGPSQADALERLEQDIERYDGQKRTGEIVETEDTLGGDPRVDGTRIGVLHLLGTYERKESVAETAAAFGGLAVDEVRSALAWADEHPDRIQRLRKERQLIREWIETHWERREIDGLDRGPYVRPDDLEVTFDEFKQRRGFDG